MSPNKIIKYLKYIGIFALLTYLLAFLANPSSIDSKSVTNPLPIESQQDYHVKPPAFPKQLPKKVIVATVACAKRKNAYIFEEALIMLKSVLISATLNGIDILEIHIYLEDLKKQDYYAESFKKFGFSPNESMVSLYFHSAVNVVPKKYRPHMIYNHRFRCAYVRAFFPTVLPTVDSILYLDTDIIITGDINQLWSQFNEMKGNQLIGVGYNNEEEDTHFGKMDKRLFGDIPHVKPKGINNGVILMNLTKMREYEWEEKLLNLYDTYSKVIKWMTIQRLMNILLYYDPGLLYIIRCDLHFIHTHCSKGLTCQYILDEQVDIHLIHGANNTFENGGIFQPIFTAYKKFNMTTGDVLQDLFYPIRALYQSRTHLKNPCNRLLAENLYKKYVTHLNLFNADLN